MITKIKDFLYEKLYIRFGLFIAFLVCLILIGIIAAMYSGLDRKLKDQLAWERYGNSEKYAQISVYFSDYAAKSEFDIKGAEHQIEQALITDSLVDPDSKSAKRAYIYDCYTTADVTVEDADTSVNVKALGVTEDFFLIHEPELITGSYFNFFDENEEKCLLDEFTAWKLFGSPNIVGKYVLIGGRAHLVTGVFANADDKVSKNSGVPASMIITSLSSAIDFGGASNIEGMELVLPNPIKGYAVGKVKEVFPDDDAYSLVVDNSARFGLIASLKRIPNIFYRGIRLDDIKLPYWENRAVVIENKITGLTILALPLVVFCFLSVCVWFYFGIIKRSRDYFRRKKDEKIKSRYGI
ncbi:MAG: ABC transporter permease [Acetatifactor sp.]|nr:ABC transporter permease [Acetatifactor sp.]